METDQYRIDSFMKAFGHCAKRLFQLLLFLVRTCLFALLLIRSPTQPEITPGYQILSHTRLYGAPILTPDAHGENISKTINIINSLNRSFGYLGHISYMFIFK